MDLPGARARRIRLDLSPRSVGVAILAVACVWLFLQVWPVLLAVAVGLMVIGALNPSVAWLEGRGVRRTHAILIVFGGLFAATAVFAALLVPRLASQASEIIKALPDAQARLAKRLEATALGPPLARSLRETRPAEVISSAAQLGLSYSSRVVEIAAYSASSLFLALYLMLDRDRMRGAAFAFIPRGYHVRVSRILLNLEAVVGGYLRGQVITSVMMAAFTLAVLGVARVPNALALSLLAGLADVLPYVGALLACGPAALSALSRGTTVAVAVLGALALYQQVESRFIVPRVYGKVLRLPAAMILISLLIGTRLLGIVGALLALPVAAGIRVILAELRVELPGDEEKDPELLHRDELGEHDFEVRAAGVPAVEAAAIATEIAVERRDEEAAEGKDGAAGGASHERPLTR